MQQQPNNRLMPESSVEGWLSQLGLDRYATLFNENQVQAQDLIRLNDDYLKEIGVSSAKHRNQMLAAPKPVITEQPRSKSATASDLQSSLKIIWLYFLAPFCAGLCCFIAEICFIAVGLPTSQNAAVFGMTSLLGAFTVFYCLLRTKHNLNLKRTLRQDLISSTLMFSVYVAMVYFGITNFGLENQTQNELMLSWFLFVGLPMILLRKLLFKNIHRIFGLAFLLCLVFSAWEILLLGYLNQFDFTGNLEEQQMAWSITLLVLIRSLSVFLFYTRAALDIRYIVSNNAQS
tara:strand:+ start:572 stop:1438 length:867 start_codon:yes stop_codon:yes gene_type:complete